MSSPPRYPQADQTARTLRGRTAVALERTGTWVEQHSRLSLLLLLAVYVCAELGYSLGTPLWHDELFTFYIAQAPSFPSMLRWIHSVDLNPPLSYALTRLSFQLFHPGTLQARLPEIAGFALALVCTFSFVSRRAGGAFGLLAAALLFGSRAGELAVQARPYGLMLGFSSLALASWQAATSGVRRRRAIAVLTLALALAALLLTHVFGVFTWAALIGAECVQSVRQRRICTSRWFALLIPLVVTALYLPLLRSHAQSAFPAAFQPSGNDIFEFYMGHIDRELICLWLTAFVVVVIAGRSWLRGSQTFGLTTPEWVAISGLIAAPLLLIADLMFRHGAFFDRYGVVACLGIAVLFSIFLRWWTAARAGAAVCASIIALLITGRLPDAITSARQAQIFRRTEPAVAPLDTRLLPDSHVPLVAASGLMFVEMQRREPGVLLQRTYYLTGGSAALDYAHASIFENMAQEARLFAFSGHVESYGQFVSAHPDFYVLGTYDYPEDWLLRKLQADGAEIRVLGRVESSYTSHEVYLVHLARAPDPTH